MKHTVLRFRTIIDKFFRVLVEAPVPRFPFTALWIIWLGIIAFTFCHLGAPKSMDPSTSSMLIVFNGITPSFWSFCNKKYVGEKLKKHYTNLVGYLYFINIIWMLVYILISVFCQWGYMDLKYLAGQSAFILCWFLSITLILVYDSWSWIIQMGSVFVIALGYYFIQKRYTGNWGANMPASVCFAIAAILISAIVSYKISQHRVKILFS